MKTLLISAFLFLSLSFLTSATAIAQYTNLHNFSGNPDGRYPAGHLISDGTFFYGMTDLGGTSNVGTIFKMMPDGSGYLKLLDFDSVNGAYASGSLMMEGTFLYGITSGGGVNNLGTIFKIKPDGTGYVKLLDCAGAVNGSYPTGSLISDGTFLYGMTEQGGTNNFGTIFKIMPDGSGYSKLLDFTGTVNGRYPEGSLIIDGIFLYGVTSFGGTNGMGTIFKIKTDGTGYTKLLDFTGATNGNTPYGALVSDGTFLYGTTSRGGSNDSGTVFKIMPDGNGYVKLLDMVGTENGGIPQASLIIDGAFLYGTTAYGGPSNHGTVFRVMSDGTGYVKLLDFNFTNGWLPRGSLISDGGFLYGTTFFGGTNGFGTIFKLDYSTVGIEDNISETNLHVYPNPTIGIVNIVCETNVTDGKLEINNMQGQTIHSSKNMNLLPGENYFIDLSTYPNGSYILNLNGYKKTVVKN